MGRPITIALIRIQVELPDLDSDASNAGQPGDLPVDRGEMLNDFVTALESAASRLRDAPIDSDLDALRVAAEARRTVTSSVALLTEDAETISSAMLSRWTPEQRALIDRAVAMPRKLPTRELLDCELTDFEAAALLNITVEDIRSSVRSASLAGNWMGDVQAIVRLLDLIDWSGRATGDSRVGGS